VERQLVARVDEPVQINSGAQHWTLDPRSAGVHLDVQAMVDQALAASREGSFLSRAVRDLFGGHVNREVALASSYSHARLRALVGQIRSSVDRPPQDASAQPTATGMETVPSHDGLRVDARVLGARIEQAMLGSAATRTVRVPAHHTAPAVTSASLAAHTPAYIVVDRQNFQLRFYSHLKLEHTYEIAVGMEGLETPAGLHHIEWEQVNPPWYVPKKAWAGALAGTVVPPGPADPLKARFMSFEGGAGIHGIDPSEYSTIGHDASHGCVRMRIPDVIELYGKSPVGTPVYVI
jgi:lipoprotein-anchoring transpeptidase ErfK/SrfK